MCSGVTDYGMMRADEMSVDSRVVSTEAKEAKTRTSVCVCGGQPSAVEFDGIGRANACVCAHGALWCSSVGGGEDKNPGCGTDQ